jgi:hypothetical protein
MCLSISSHLSLLDCKHQHSDAPILTFHPFETGCPKNTKCKIQHHTNFKNQQ